MISPSTFPKSRIASLFLLVFLPIVAFSNLVTERFWLQDTITREVYGPIVRQTGYRFQIQSESFVVLDSVPSKIRVATYPAGVPYGPFPIANNHILPLGAHAYSILNVQPVEVPDLPPDLRNLTGLRVQGDPEQPTVAPQNQLVRKSLPIREWPLRIGGWIEPTRRAKYDWTIGGFSGEKALDLKSTRMGANAEWGNLFFQFNITPECEQSGSLTPPMVSLDHINISSGSGSGATLGWIQPFTMDSNWDLLVGGLLDWSSESYDLSATVLARTTPQAQADPTLPPSYSYEYNDITSSFKRSEWLFGLVTGIDYHEHYWGVRALLRIDLLSNISTEGSVRVSDTDLSISCEQSHPLNVELNGYCYLLDHIRGDVAFQFGFVQAIRLGVSWEF